MRRGTPVRMAPSGFALEGATVEWLVNGKAGSRACSHTGTLRKTDTLQARVGTGAGNGPFPGRDGGEFPPEIRSVRFTPADGRPGNSVALETSRSTPTATPFRSGSIGR